MAPTSAAKALEAGAIQPPLVAIHQQGGTDLDDDTLCIGQIDERRLYGLQRS